MKIPKPIKLDSGNWFIRLRLGGESIPITMPTKAECIREAQLIKAEHIAGKRQPKAKAEDMTIAQLLDAYIKSVEGTASPSTVRGYDIIKARFSGISEKQYSSIANWQSVIDDMAKKYAPKTVKNSWACFCTALRKKDLTPPEVRLPAVPKETREFLTYDEIPIFLEAIKGDKAEREALIYLHSFRTSELYAMRWENHVDLKRKMLRSKGAEVRGRKSKVYLNDTNKNESSQRWVPIMIDRLYDLLNAEENKTGKVARFAQETVRRRINQACASAGLPKVGAHGLRHSFASLAAHVGMSELETMRLGGWSDYDTMRKIYTHIAEKDMERHINAMADFYREANKNVNENANESAATVEKSI